MDNESKDTDGTLGRPFPAYDGDGKYIFISYAHKDAELVFQEIKMFHDEGFPIWYDQGLTPGQEWDDEIAIALMNCSLLVVFISKNSMASKNVKDEIKMALNRDIDVVPIYLEKTELPPAFELRLSNKHAIFKYSLPEKDYLFECFKAFRAANILTIEVEQVQTIENNDFTNSIEEMLPTAHNCGTMDFGIDLGTEYSCIAKVDGNNTVVVPNKTDNKNSISSAVYIKKNGTIFVGDKAKNKMATDPENGYAEFKLRMGSDHVYEFAAAGKKMTPVELSAEILKNLRATVMEKYQKDLQAAVITVPADFSASQTQATKEAAKLAGFKEVILIQEPTAAAMAYGMQNSQNNEIWLIYDLGGGTFDVSIMKKNLDEIDNINNLGDTYLGGKLIDWDIVDKILAPAVIDELGLTDFERKNPKYIKQFAKLKKAAEKAKTNLFTFDTAEVEIENFIVTEDGDFFDFEYDMSRSELEEVMEPYVDRTINHCRKALEDIDLDISDVTKIILVGGSTLSPYIHQRLTAEFGIPLKFSIDPTTVVARGAAIFAGTQSYTPEVTVTSGQVSIEVLYDKTGDEDEFDVNGKIIVPEGSPEGYSIEFKNTKTGNSSGKIPVNSKGVFMASLIAEDEDDYNIYEITVYDASGNIAQLAPGSVNTIKYKIDVVISKPKLSHTIGFGKYGNELYVIANKGTELPFEFEYTFKSSNIVRAGNPSDEIYIPLYQGNMMKADRNTLIGNIRITGADIKSDLPADSEIELSVIIDESMTIEGSVYIEFLDQQFDMAMEITSDEKSHEDLVKEFKKHKERYNNLLTDAARVSNLKVQILLNQIKTENMIENIETFLENSETDLDALDNASKRINEFANVLDYVEVILEKLELWDELKRETDVCVLPHSENACTIDFGIDLGTTTSSIVKVDGNNTVVVPNKTDNKNFVSSAVYIKKNGTVFIGDKAKNKIATDPENGYTEFKLRMGSDHVYEFAATGKKMTPIELSAEILKNLRATVMEKYQKDLQAVVITVPADFTAPQILATKEAAKLAGFKKVVFIQEPTAAAMAYGFQNSDDNEIWMVYDLGGATFDVSLMKKNSDGIDNINNQGDAYLGGKLIDWDIVDKILAPAVIDELGLTDFERNNPKYIKQFAKLKRAAENAKIDLSNSDTAEVEIENLMVTEDADLFDFEYVMSRSQLEEVMKPYVDRTINHCRRALECIGLDICDVTKIILVGGSTLSPYIHKRLMEEFNIPLDYSIDPITVVARGAAIFAGTQPYALEATVKSEQVSVESHLVKRPFPAYDGDEPYIFVSYAHKDAERVFPELVRFKNEGFHIWYDQGIAPGMEWRKGIVEHLYNSSLFIVFLSEASAQSGAVLKEIILANEKGIPIVPIYLEYVELNAEMEYELLLIQAIFKCDMTEQEYEIQLRKFLNSMMDKH